MKWRGALFVLLTTIAVLLILFYSGAFMHGDA